jgi:hypothetical protein
MGRHLVTLSGEDPVEVNVYYQRLTCCSLLYEEWLCAGGTMFFIYGRPFRLFILVLMMLVAAHTIKRQITG